MASYSPIKLTLFEFQQCQLHRWNRFRGVNDTAETVSAVSMTPLKLFPRCHWHRWNFRPDPHSCFLGVIDTVETASAVSMTPLKLLPRCHPRGEGAYYLLLLGHFCPFDCRIFTIWLIFFVSVLYLFNFRSVPRGEGAYYLLLFDDFCPFVCRIFTIWLIFLVAVSL
jgi:hypothetical protein